MFNNTFDSAKELICMIILIIGSFGAAIVFPIAFSILTLAPYAGIIFLVCFVVVQQKPRTADEEYHIAHRPAVAQNG